MIGCRPDLSVGRPSPSRAGRGLAAPPRRPESLARSVLRRPEPCRASFRVRSMMTTAPAAGLWRMARLLDFTEGVVAFNVGLRLGRQRQGVGRIAGSRSATAPRFHFSGNPASRRPSNKIGKFCGCAISHLSVSRTAGRTRNSIWRVPDLQHRLKVYSTIEAHPLDQVHGAGVRVSINTDDCSLLETNLRDREGDV